MITPTLPTRETKTAPARGITFSSHMVRALLAGKKTVTRRLITHAHADLSEFQAAHELAPGEWIFWNSDHAHLAEFTRRAYAPGEGVRCPLGAVGDTLYVRETWRVGSWDEGVIAVDYAADGHARAEWLAVTEGQWLRLVHQSVDDVEAAGLTINEHGRYTWPFGQAPTRWRLPRYMPRVASRISLEIQSVRPERLHEITDVDAINEGVCSLPDEWVAAHWPEYVAERDRVHAHNDALTAAGQYLGLTRPPLGPSPRERFRALWIDMHGADSWEANPWVWRLAVQATVAEKGRA